MHSRQKLRHNNPVFRVRLYFGYHPRVIMVFKKKRHPALPGVVFQPVDDVFLIVIKVIFIVVKPTMARRFQVTKGENQIQLRPVIGGEQFLVADIVTVVIIGRVINGGKPDRIHAQAF